MKRSKPDDAFETSPDAPLVGQFMHTWFRLGQAIKREIVPVLEQFHGADFFDFMVLNCIKDGGIHPGGIAETLVVQPSQISRTLEGLVKRGLVERSLDAEDSRRVRLELTVEGHKVLKEVYATIRTILEPSFAEVGHEHIRNIMQSITQMTQAISSREHTPESVELEQPALQAAAIQTAQEVSQ
jgi:MarR family transcriptional regulator, organic hydroperoxide resistance regulator